MTELECVSFDYTLTPGFLSNTFMQGQVIFGSLQLTDLQSDFNFLWFITNLRMVGPCHVEGG